MFQIILGIFKLSNLKIINIKIVRMANKIAVLMNFLKKEKIVPINSNIKIIFAYSGKLMINWKISCSILL